MVKHPRRTWWPNENVVLGTSHDGHDLTDGNWTSGWPAFPSRRRTVYPAYHYRRPEWRASARPNARHCDCQRSRRGPVRSVVSRLARLERLNRLTKAPQRLRIQYGYVQTLPDDYTGPRHVVTVKRLPSGSGGENWFEWRSVLDLSRLQMPPAQRTLRHPSVLRRSERAACCYDKLSGAHPYKPASAAGRHRYRYGTPNAAPSFAG